MSRITHHQEKALADTPPDSWANVSPRWSRLTMERLATRGYVTRKQFGIPGVLRPVTQVTLYMRSEKGQAYLLNQIKKTREINASIRRRRNGR